MAHISVSIAHPPASLHPPSCHSSSSDFSFLRLRNYIVDASQPKSEAWLLAYYQKNESVSSSPYQNCACFEKLAGNDSAKPKNSAKHILESLLDGQELDYGELRQIEWHRVDMPSFNRFRDRVYNVCQQYRAMN